MKLTFGENKVYSRGFSKILGVLGISSFFGGGGFGTLWVGGPRPRRGFRKEVTLSFYRRRHLNQNVTATKNTYPQTYFRQKKPRVRKIVCLQFWGRKMAAPISRAPGIFCVLSAGEPPGPENSSFYGGGVFWVLGGRGGRADFNFNGRGFFLRNYGEQNSLRVKMPPGTKPIHQ